MTGSGRELFSAPTTKVAVLCEERNYRCKPLRRILKFRQCPPESTFKR